MSEHLERAEAKAEPAVFRGAVAAWPALRRWAGPRGLRHLASVAGDAPVQVMLSTTRHFYGNIDSHQPAECTLSDVLAAAEQQLEAAAATADGNSSGTSSKNGGAAGGEEAQGGSGSGGGAEVAPNMYLAQQPLNGPGLEALLPDVPVPSILGGRQLDATNLWISPCASQSSLHYDPYQNLLAVVTGSKTVTLISPEATPALYPKSPLGEASNHSAVMFGTPDNAAHPLYQLVQPQAMQVRLGPGDALFIPEGWWHQVDSEAATIAVNFWWSSVVSAGLRAAPHLHHYYLRLLQSSVVAQATKSLMDGISQEAAAEAAAAVAAAAAKPEAAATGNQPPSKRARRGPEGSAGDPREGKGRGGSSAEGLSAVEEWAVAALETSLAQGAEEAPIPVAEATAAAAADVRKPGAAAMEDDRQGDQLVQQDKSNGEGGSDGGSGDGAALCGDVWRAAAQVSNCRIARAAVLLARPGALGSDGTAAVTGNAPAAAAGGGGGADGPDPLGLRNPVTPVLAALPPLALANALYALATRNPAAACELLTVRLPPLGAALLTEKFEAAEAALGAGGGSGGSSGSGRAEDTRGSPVGDRCEGDAATAAAGGGGAAAADQRDSREMEGSQRQQGPHSSRLAVGSMREVYAALYGPEVGADPETVLARLLGGKMAVAAAVAAAVLPAGGGASGNG